MTNEIQKALSVLVGLPLLSLGRAVDLAWFEFGSRKTVKGPRGDEREVGEYALHVQCAWRITSGDSIVTGRGDIFCTPEETDEPTPSDFDWQKGNRFDKIVQQLFRNETRQFMVQDVAVGEAGSLAIRLEHGYQLEVFPQDSESGEHWRFFKPFVQGEPHLVVSGRSLKGQ
jgi:hypothetical protein